RVLALESLRDTEAAELIQSVLEGEVDPRTLRRIQEAGGGNPLFLEEVAAMLVDQGALERGDTGWRASRLPTEVSIPATIAGLLEARLDGLDREARDVLVRASVIGKEFRTEQLEA